VEWISRSFSETLAIGKKIGESLQPNSVLSLFGDLGAGKTSIVKGIAQGAAGVDPSFVTSPTFTYLNIYRGTKVIYHFDLYRLHGVEDFLAMGFDEYFDCGGIVCIEWSEKIAKLLPAKCVKLTLSHTSDGMRRIECI
jgi:tRNA threonylcarbamoyladenosine biosynthesis protein TsaE